MAAHRTIFGTKAETLKRLSKHRGVYSIPGFHYFSVADWRSSPEKVLNRLNEIFPPGGSALVVRSSAAIEDGHEESMAGAFASVPDIPPGNQTDLSRAIEDVIATYDDSLDNQILVQVMVRDVAVSGVIMTHDLDDGSPYYMINYDDVSGKTDSVTGGVGSHKAVLIHRSAAETHIESERLRLMLRLARELESICGAVPMDVEFCISKDGQVHLFQVRRIATARSWQGDTGDRVNRTLHRLEEAVEDIWKPRPGLVGGKTILGNMPDWNPAEIIGATPRPLTASLYREIVTRSIWRKARARMGYRKVEGAELMVMLAGRPFIDVRASLNSFLPAGIDDSLAAKIVDAELDRLASHPQYHDKLEFEIAPTVTDFTLRDELTDRYGHALTDGEMKTLLAALRIVTKAALNTGETGSLAWAEGRIQSLNTDQEASGEEDLHGPPAALLSRITVLLEDCRARGTEPFAVLARHGFIAEIILRSAVVRGALGFGRLQAFKRSVHTVAGDLTEDLRAVCEGSKTPEVFMARYGHLRPGTYDILSRRYGDRRDLFSGAGLPPMETAPSFEPTAAEITAITALFAETGLEGCDGASLFSYARRAIVGREFGKFVFTRTLSAVLELIAAWGMRVGLGRDELSYLTLGDILSPLQSPLTEDAPPYFGRLIKRGRELTALARAVKLSYLIRDVDDLYVVPLHRAAPNFITGKRVEAEVQRLDAHDEENDRLNGVIVCIENADPGFDWIFTRGIAGLVTKFGGANSHMAIRCAEFGLPAAIGCGELLYNRVSAAHRAELNCADQTLKETGR